MEHSFDALFMVSQLLTDEIAVGAVFSCGSAGFGLNLSTRLRLLLWVMKGSVGHQPGGGDGCSQCKLQKPVP